VPVVPALLDQEQLSRLLKVAGVFPERFQDLHRELADVQSTNDWMVEWSYQQCQE